MDNMDNKEFALKLIYGDDVTFLPITDDVIAMFVMQGANESDLLAMKKQGGMYCPERNSIVFPPEIDMPI